MGNRTVTVKSFRLPLENGLYLEGEVRVPSGTVRDGDDFDGDIEGRSDSSGLGGSYSRDKSEGNVEGKSEEKSEGKGEEKGEGKSKGILPVVILSHGFRGHKDWAFWPDVAGRLAESGFYTVSFNFSRIAARRLAEAGAAGNSGAAGSAEIAGIAAIAETPERAEASATVESGGIAGTAGSAESAGPAIIVETAERLVAESATLTRELQDLELVLSSVQNGGLPLAELADTGRIGILGHSRAGGGNIIFAAEHPEVAALVVWNGGSPPPRTIQDSAAEPTLLEQILERDQELNRERFNIEQALGRATASALIIQGDQDRASLLEQNARFREQAPQHRYASVKGADHTFNTTDPYGGPTPELNEALALTLEFLHGKFG